MKKEMKKYHDKYKDIPKTMMERLALMLDVLKIKDKDLIAIRSAMLRLLNIQWKEYNFIIYFFPKATPRARSSGRSRTFYVKNAADYSKFFKEFLEECGDLRDVISTPAKITANLYLPIPDQMSKVEKILAELKLLFPLVKPDWDNAGKTYSDMVQNHLIVDDSLFVDGIVIKRYSFKPRIEIKIQYLEEYDCNYNKKKVEKWKTYKDNAHRITEKDSTI